MGDVGAGTWSVECCGFLSACCVPTAEWARELRVLFRTSDRGVLTTPRRSPSFTALTGRAGNIIWVPVASKPLSFPSYQFFLSLKKIPGSNYFLILNLIFLYVPTVIRLKMRVFPLCLPV